MLKIETFGPRGNLVEHTTIGRFESEIAAYQAAMEPTSKTFGAVRNAWASHNSSGYSVATWNGRTMRSLTERMDALAEADRYESRVHAMR